MVVAEIAENTVLWYMEKLLCHVMQINYPPPLCFFKKGKAWKRNMMTFPMSFKKQQRGGHKWPKSPVKMPACTVVDSSGS